MSFFSTAEKAFGLDISDKNLRLVQLFSRGQKTGIQLYNEVELPVGCIKEGEIVQEKIFLEYLNKLIKTRHGYGQLANEVIITLPESQTFLKTIEVGGSWQSDEELKAKIAELLPQHLPLNLEDIYYDWQVLKKTDEQTALLVGASPKQIIDSYFNIISQTSFLPVAFEVEAAAIARLLIGHNNDKDPQIIIDIGANRTGLFLYDEEMIKFTISLPISGNKITQIISETLELDWNQAEQAKIVCGLDKIKCQGALLEILSNTIDELAEEIIKATNFYYDNFPHASTIKKIVLCGGGANFEDIGQVVSSKLNIPTIISDPLKNIHRPPSFFTPVKAQSYITAIGLALRGLNQRHYL